MAERINKNDVVKEPTVRISGKDVLRSRIGYPGSPSPLQFWEGEEGWKEAEIRLHRFLEENKYLPALRDLEQIGLADFAAANRRFPGGWAGVLRHMEFPEDDVQVVSKKMVEGYGERFRTIDELLNDIHKTIDDQKERELKLAGVQKKSTARGKKAAEEPQEEKEQQESIIAPAVGRPESWGLSSRAPSRDSWYTREAWDMAIEACIEFGRMPTQDQFAYRLGKNGMLLAYREFGVGYATITRLIVSEVRAKVEKAAELKAQQRGKKSA